MGFQLWLSTFKLKTWKPIFGMVPKAENLKEKSSPTFRFSTLVFNFQIENLKNSFWDGPKNWKLERRIMSYLLVFNFGFQFLNWKLGNQFLEGSQKLKTWKKNHVLPSGFQLWFSIFELKTWKPIFGRVPKVENLKEKSCPTFGFSTVVFNFQVLKVENLKANFGDGPKSWKLERKIKSYPWVFNFGFQLLSWRLENLQWNSLRSQLKPFQFQLKSLHFQSQFFQFQLKSFQFQIKPFNFN